MISRDIKLRNRLKEIRKEFPEVDDIILFGSSVRGNENPGDVDVLVLFKTRVDKGKEYEIRKELDKSYKDVSIISKTRKTLVETSFDARESIFFEGLSLITGEYIAGKYGFSSLGAFKYHFRNWDKLRKTKFYYALNGRGNQEGMLKILKGIKLSDSLVLVPLDKIDQLREFLESWEIEYLYIPLLLPQRLNKKSILQQ